MHMVDTGMLVLNYIAGAWTRTCIEVMLGGWVCVCVGGGGGLMVADNLMRVLIAQDTHKGN